MSSSSPDSSFNPVNQVKLFKQFYDGLSDALVSGVGGVIATFFIGLALVVDSIRRLITDPLFAMGSAIADFMDGLIGGASDIIRQGVETSVQSIAPGQMWAVGPLTFALSILAMGVGLYALAWVLGRAETSDAIPFTFTDIPFIGVDEDDEGEGE